MRNRIFAATFAGAAALAALVSPAVGQEPVSALRGHNSNAPVDVAADRIEVQDRADRAIFSGNVLVRQAQLTLAAPRLTVAYSSRGGIEIDRLNATGGVTIRSPSETVVGNTAIYDLDSKLITLVGGVTLTRGDSRVSGGRLVLDLNTGRVVLDGGAGAPGTSTEGGRVTGTFTVPQRGG